MVSLSPELEQYLVEVNTMLLTLHPTLQAAFLRVLVNRGLIDRVWFILPTTS